VRCNALQCVAMASRKYSIVLGSLMVTQKVCLGYVDYCVCVFVYVSVGGCVCMIVNHFLFVMSTQEQYEFTCLFIFENSSKKQKMRASKNMA